MNEASLTRLKIIVERAVRPVRASTRRKRAMREELLAHVLGVFEEETARIGDDRAALERTALRFGDPTGVTGELQATVPSGDGIRRSWEGRPGESALRAGLRIAGVIGALAMFSLGVVLLATGRDGAWPREAVITCVRSALALPAYLFGLVFLTVWMEKALYGPAGRSWPKVALVTAGSWLFMLLLGAALTWCTGPTEWDYSSAVLITIWLGVTTPVFLYGLARSSIVRRRYHEEWASLDIAG
jgi:hypothetical protein